MKRFLLGAILLILLGGGGYLAYQNHLLSQRVPVEVINIVKTPTFVEGMTIAAKTGNDIYGQSGQKIDDMKQAIAKSDDAPEEKQKAIATLDSFTGNYSEAIAEMEKVCTADNCKKNSITIRKSGFNVRTGDKESEYPNSTDFSLRFNEVSLDKNDPDQGEISAYKNLFYRVRASKKGYLDDIFIVNNTEKIGDKDAEFFEFTPTFYKYDATLKVDASKKFTASTEHYTYTGEGNNFSMPDGTPAKGEIEIFFFDITPNETWMSQSSLLNLDSFLDDSTFSGTGMMTYGMPFVRAYIGDTELKITKPIKGTGIIIVDDQLMPLPDMTYITKNTDIDVAKATDLGLPPFWRLDLDKGVWEESTFQLLDSSGKYSFLFY